MGILSYAQNFEDVVLWRALGHIEGGTYVDVGAQHPRIDSISRAFYEHGWRGIHIEPVPAFAALLRADRPDETVLQVALAEKNGMLELNVFADTGLSTAIDGYARRHESERGYAVQRITVPVTTLANVLESLQGRPVHWLKVDVEGYEEQVLRGWDSRAVRPWVIVVEATIPNSPETDFAGWDPILVNADYRFVYFDGLNRFYIAAEHGELEAAFARPPNVFDFAELAGSASWDLCRPVKLQLGQRIAEIEEERDISKAEVAQLRDQLLSVQTSLAERDRLLLAEISKREQALTNAAVAREEARLLASAAADATAARFASLLEASTTRIGQLELEVSTFRAGHGALGAEINQARENAHHWWRMADHLMAEIAALHASRSWKLTLPLRLAMRAARRGRRLLVRVKRVALAGDFQGTAVAVEKVGPVHAASAASLAPVRHAAPRLTMAATRVYQDLQQAIEEKN